MKEVYCRLSHFSARLSPLTSGKSFAAQVRLCWTIQSLSARVISSQSIIRVWIGTCTHMFTGSQLVGVGEGASRRRAHHGQPLKAEPSPVTELPPRLDLFDDENALEADPERAFLVEARLVRGDVPGKKGRVCRGGVSFPDFASPALDAKRLTEVGLTVRDADLRLVNRKEFADSVPSSVAAACP